MAAEISSDAFIAKKLTGKILAAVHVAEEQATFSFKDGSRLIAWTAVRVDGQVVCGEASVQEVTLTHEALMLELNEGRIVIGRVPESGPECYLFQDNDGALIVDTGD